MAVVAKRREDEAEREWRRRGAADLKRREEGEEAEGEAAREILLRMVCRDGVVKVEDIAI